MEDSKHAFLLVANERGDHTHFAVHVCEHREGATFATCGRLIMRNDEYKSFAQMLTAGAHATGTHFNITES